MVIVFDVGNTNITFGVYRDKSLLFVSRMLADPRRMEDQYAVEIQQILALNGLPYDGFAGAVLCSVVPTLTGKIQSAIRRLTGVNPLIVGPGIKTGLDIRIDNPSQLGADMVASAVGALAKYSMPCVIFDLGTATKASVLDAGGAFLGAVFMPGVQVSLDALATRTAQLPPIGLDSAPEHIIGTNTVDSMASGSIYGTAAMIDGVTARIETELGMPVNLVVTGGLSAEIARQCKTPLAHDANLILDGLMALYRKNQKS